MTDRLQTDPRMGAPVPEIPPVRAPSVLSPHDLRGPAGRLESLYSPGAADAPWAAIVCHPHPLYGGTMHNKVVYHAAKVLQQLGLPVLRFNFRGAGASEGAHDRGEGEQQDLLAAIDWLTRTTGLPLVVAGFSFGAYVTLRACCGAAGAPANVRALVALGLPVQAGDRAYTYDFLSACTLPKLFISGAADAFGPVASIEQAVAACAPPRQLAWIEGADHFFQRPRTADQPLSGLAAMQAVLRGWLAAQLPARPAIAGEVLR